VAEFNAGGAVTRYYYGTSPIVPDYMLKNNTYYRIITDQLGSVRLVVNTSTGAVAQRMTYDVFGRMLEDTNPGFQCFGFAGGMWDATTGLVRFGARDYDPTTGRWTSRDPGLLSGGSNLYAYALNDPVNNVDRNGRWPIDSGSADRWGGFAGQPSPGGFGIVAGAAVMGGLGEGGAWMDSKAWGVFTDPCGHSTTGGFTSKGSYLLSPGNATLGVYGGASLGGFYTNATNAQQLYGPFQTVDVEFPLIQLQYSWSGNIVIVSISGGVGWYGGATYLPTNTTRGW
jgi:RHS repeat-associated protein